MKQRTLSKRRFSQVLVNFWVDIILFIAFIFSMNYGFTGIVIHEWLGIAFGISLIYHLLLHWKWIVAMSKKLLGRMPGMNRLKYVVN